MDSNDNSSILFHLDAMEARIRLDIAEVRTGQQQTAELVARHDARIDSHATQLGWIWGSFGTGLLTVLGAVVSHLLGFIGVGVHHGK